MSDEFWWGVVATIIVGGPVAVLVSVWANIYTPRFVDYLDRRKLLKTERTKQQALLVFNRIKAFHDHIGDRYAHYVLLGSGATVSAIFASTLILIISLKNDEYPIPIEYGVVLLFSVIGILLTVILLGAIYETARLLERFEDYRAEFEKRWGSTDE